MENLKVVSLIAENVKKLRAVEIHPTGELVEITGRNGAGKSSVLDSLWWALAGAKHIQAVPIRRGANTARIRLDLGELIVERRFVDPGPEHGGPIRSTLTVEKADGARFPSPQTMLDALLGALTFDPLAFVNLDPDKRYKALRGIVPIDVDIDQLDGLNRRDFDKRTEVNRDAKARRAQADGILVPPALPERAIDTAALMDRMANAAKTNAEIETRKGRRADAGREIEDLRRRATNDRAEVMRLRAEADRLEEGAGHLETRATSLQKKLDEAEPLPAPIDVEALRTELAEAEAINRGIEQRIRKTELVTQASDLEAAAKTLTETIAAREQAKAAAIAKAPMPVEGLGFGEGVVTFGGVPFEQASSAEQLRVSVAIAMAANPKLRVIRIQEGSLLDADNLALIAMMARERDYQVWIERVDTTGKVGVVIEDGMVIAVNGEPEQAP
jgi:energy-coupling factor transporter ATP-binding protein EcfA2